MRLVLMLIACVLLALGSKVHAQSTSDPGVNLACPDSDVFSSVIDSICWDCFTESIQLFGVGSKPDGASADLDLPMCTCIDALGVPEFGWPLGFWAPQRVNEVVTTPWCSPALGGIRLQDSFTGAGQNQGAVSGEAEVPSAFYQYHYFSYPIMAMLSMMLLPDCSDGYVDFDLMYISEIDPMWNDDILSLLLNPEAVIFSTPLAYAWCAADCVMTTADSQMEEFYGCAGCDGSLYPFTGNVFPQTDPVAGSSLITQRVLASLHRKGLAEKTIGDAAMCKPEYFPTIPRSQYRFSMLWPVPEASNNASGTLTIPFIGDSNDAGDIAANDPSNNAGMAGGPATPYGECCHPMGMSTARWCTPAGGRTRPGKDNAYLYLIWKYRNCCVRSLDDGG